MKKILACIDFSDVTRQIVSEATMQAMAMGAKAHLLHIVPEPDHPMYSPGAAMTVSLARDVQPELRRLKALACQMFGVETTADVREGCPTDEIINVADFINADMIVMGSHGHGALFEMIVGSVTEEVIRRASVPVLVIPSRGKRGRL